MSHFGIPWPIVRWGFRNIRKFFFSKNPPEQRHLLIEESVEDIERILGQNHFTNSFELSYHYYGEILNMRRPEYNESDPERPWYQLHVRGFQEGRSIKIIAHLEYEPSEYPELHLHTDNLSVEAGIREIKKIFDDKQIRYKEVLP